VRRYNREGLAGLETRAGQGRQPILSEDERQLVAERVAAGPQAGDVCSLRGVDFQKFIEARFGKLMSLTSVSRVLHELGDEWLVPRPKHRKNDPAAMAAFQKKVSEELARLRSPLKFPPTPLVGVVGRSLHDSKSAEGKKASSAKTREPLGQAQWGGLFEGE
jgi:transposase